MAVMREVRSRALPHVDHVPVRPLEHRPVDVPVRLPVLRIRRRGKHAPSASGPRLGLFGTDGFGRSGVRQRFKLYCVERHYLPVRHREARIATAEALKPHVEGMAPAVAGRVEAGELQRKDRVRQTEVRGPLRHAARNRVDRVARSGFVSIRIGRACLGLFEVDLVVVVSRCLLRT